MAIQSPNDQLTPREAYIYEYEKDQEIRNLDFTERMKDKDIELQRLQAKWSAWLRIPLIIVKLPLLIILALAYIVHAIRGIEPSENFWNLLK